MKNLLLFIPLVLFYSCTEEPEANFKTDKSEYTAGEIVHLTNTSMNAIEYRWLLPGGKIVKTENAEFLIDNYAKTERLSFTLEAYSKKGKKKNESTKTVSVKAAKGSLMFWTSSSEIYTITLNTIVIGKTSMYYNTAPDCGSVGTVTAKDLTPGTYKFTVVDSSGYTNWTSTIQVEPNVCLDIKI